MAAGVEAAMAASASVAKSTADLLVRSSAGVHVAMRQREGAGFVVRRPIGARISVIDPFLLLDHFGPMEYVVGDTPAIPYAFVITGPGEAVGAPDHPHRGFETVSYILSGGMQHRDSAGNHGDLQPGDVQWMTAGRGVVHSETPSDELMEKGGVMEGFQLWVNLPAAKKMVPPRYQDIRSERIPVVGIPGWEGSTVKVVAGESCGASAVIDTHTPITYLDVTLQPGAQLVQPVARSHNALAYVFRGAGVFGRDEQAAREGTMVLFESDGDAVVLRNPDTNKDTCRALFIAGEPIGEPVARYGPFVMNTKEEIMQAFDDFRSGRMGAIDGEEERHAAAAAARAKQKETGKWDRDL